MGHVGTVRPKDWYTWEEGTRPPGNPGPGPEKGGASSQLGKRPSEEDGQHPRGKGAARRRKKGRKPSGRGKKGDRPFMNRGLKSNNQKKLEVWGKLKREEKENEKALEDGER